MGDLLSKILGSPVQKAIHYAYKMSTRLYELLLNIDTGQSASGPGARYDLPNNRGLFTDRAVNNDNIYYEPANYYTLARIMRVLSPRGDDVFYDIGCGKGRIVCAAARLRLKRVVGIDLFEELCVAARHNAGRLRGRKTPIDIICVDATKGDYSDGTVFTLFNPFGEATMRAVIGSIRDSFHGNPRDIRIGYYMPECEHILAKEPWLDKYASFRTMSSSVSFWRSRNI